MGLWSVIEHWSPHHSYNVINYTWLHILHWLVLILYKIKNKVKKKTIHKTMILVPRNGFTDWLIILQRIWSYFQSYHTSISIKPQQKKCEINSYASQLFNICLDFSCAYPIWRKKTMIAPTNYFSSSDKQILNTASSIILAITYPTIILLCPGAMWAQTRLDFCLLMCAGLWQI